MAPPNDLQLFVATPSITIDGRDRERANALLVGMTMTERDGGIASLELRLTNFASDPGGAAQSVFEGDEAINLGATIEVNAGPSSDQQPIFKGRITALEAELSESEAPQMVIFAEDALQQARMTRRTRIYESITVSALASQIASNLGLSADASGLSGEPSTQVQLNESDLAFLRRVLDRNDCDMQVADTQLKITKRGDRQNGNVRLVMNNDLLRARVIADLAHQVSSVTVTGWDETQGQRVSANSSGTSFGPGTGRKGSEVLSEAIGDRAEHIGHLTAASNAEAQALADAAFDERARRFLSVEGVTIGNARLRIGTHVELVGLGTHFDNTYLVTSTSHQFNLATGYRTMFEAECAFWGES
jgi:phage protein D